ncbi:MAG: hypothetical protein ACE141_08665 [Bryobacteraceae bacterium]
MGKRALFWLALAGGAVRAWSEPATIVNPSFEQDVIATGAPSSYDGGVWYRPGVGPSGWVCQSATVARPGRANLFPGGVPDGVNIVAVGWNGPGGTGELTQTLSTRVQPNTTYTLTVSVGRRSDTPFASYAVSLLAGGVTLASGTQQSPASGAFVTERVTYQSGPNPAQSGQALTIRLANTSGNGQVAFDKVALDVTSAAPLPVLSANGVVNAADYTTEMALGELIALYGSNLAPRTEVASQVPLPTTLAGTSVEMIDAGQTVTLPLVFVSAGQINAQLPYRIQSASVQIRVKTANGTSNAVPINVVACAPRLLTKTQDGRGEPLLLHTDYTLVSAAAPARPGEILILFLIGLGAATPSIEAGEPAGDGTEARPLNLVAADVAVRVSGQPAEVLFSGLAPGWIGLYQINFRVPEGVLTGTHPITVSGSTNASQAGVRFEATSAWQFAGSTAIGAAGGSAGTGGMALTVSPGVFSEQRQVGVFTLTEALPAPMEKYRASGVYAVSGMPATLAAPVTVALDLASSRRPGPAWIVLRTATGEGDGVLYLEAQVQGDRATVTLPATEAMPAASGEPRQARSPAAEVQSSWTLWAITGYYAYKTSSGRFRIVYPAEDLVEGGAEEIADALEDAYQKLEKLGLDWSRRSGIGSWPMEISIEYFGGERASRWGEEGSSMLGVNRQGINLNATFLRDRANFEYMRVTAAHELFHLMQSLYDPARAPSAWLWFEEASATWFERRAARSADYLPPTVAPNPLNPLASSNNYEFLHLHGLEFPPGDPREVQEHGYGASLFLEYLSQRYGDAIIGTLTKMMATRAPGLLGRSLYSPVRAIDLETSNVAVPWQQFCEEFMAGRIYGGRPVFPRAAEHIVSMGAGSRSYRFQSAADTGTTFTLDYPDLSAKVFFIDIRKPGWPSNTRLTVSLEPAGAAAAILYKRTGETGWERVATVDNQYAFPNAEQLEAAGSRLVIMVVNPRAVQPYSGTTPISLSVRLESGQMSALQRTGRVEASLFAAHFIRRANGTVEPMGLPEKLLVPETPVSNYPNCVALRTQWSGRSFEFSSRCTYADGQSGETLLMNGTFNSTGTRLETGRFETTTFNLSGGTTIGFSVRDLPVAAGQEAAGCRDFSAELRGPTVKDYVSDLKLAYRSLRYPNENFDYSHTDWNHTTKSPVLLVAFKCVR